MILTPSALRRARSSSQCSTQFLQILDEPVPSKSPSTSHQLLDVPLLQLPTLDHHGYGQRKKSSAASSQCSDKTVPNVQDHILNVGETLLKEESVEEEKEQQEDKTKSEENQWMRRVRVVLPHVALATVVVVYTLFGAAVFFWIEQANEKEEKMVITAKLRQLRDEYLEKMWNLSQNMDVTNEEFTDQALIELEAVLQETLSAFDDGLTDESINTGIIEPDWTYSAAVLLSATIITTVGYGNLVPKTFAGRLFCIVYAVLGIPLTLITIADIGKFVGSAIIWTYERFMVIIDTIVHAFRSLANRLCFRRRRAANLIVERRKSRRYSLTAKPRSSTKAQQTCRTNTASDQGQNDEIDEGELKEEPEETRSDKEDLELGKEENEDEGGSDEDQEEEDEEEGENEQDEIPVPPFFILLIVVGFTALSSLLFSGWEGWPYLDSFYYCLITITTVGFGDLVPSNASYTAFVLLFIFFGLILATMCIDMVGTHYISKIHYMGRKLQDAKAAFAFIGGKAITLKTWAKELKNMQRQYGMTDEQMKQLMGNPEEYVQLIEAARMNALQARALWVAYEPKDSSLIRYIDHNGGTGSERSPVTPLQASEILASITNTDSTVLNRTNRENGTEAVCVPRNAV